MDMKKKKITNFIRFSSQYNIDPKKLDDLGVFDPILTIDTQLYIDPLLLKDSTESIFSNKGFTKLNVFFEDIFKIIKGSLKNKNANNALWREAERKLHTKEIPGICLGYGISSITGRNLDREKRKIILNSARDIIEAGLDDPDFFNLIPLIEKGIGADTISDLTSYIIEDEIIEYTKKILDQLGIVTDKYIYKGKSHYMLMNMNINKIIPILLLPKHILRDLPIATDFEEISSVSAHNSLLRKKFNKLLGDKWYNVFKAQDKVEIKKTLLADKELSEVLLNELKRNSKSYDFKNDPNYSLYFDRIIDNAVKKDPIVFTLDHNYTSSDINQIVKVIIHQFQFLVEKKGINKLFYEKDNKPKHEEVLQLVFFLVAYSYCKSNDISISPEVDCGRGLIDFKFSKGFKKEVIVELKKSTNDIMKGYDKQLEIYKDSEETEFGHYVIIDVGRIGKKYEKLIKYSNTLTETRSEIYYVDALLKDSASK